MSVKRKLHWVRSQPGLHGQWHTEEGIDGTPDFIIVKQGYTFHAKMRSSAQWKLFSSLDDAKAWAESI